ncbi:hypothetical protein [Polyangium sp. 15x6]|uniref:hypothetical protein n=1 Tax=Polyangium sp. 15x6 TaxID=3042687 RepID=UPI00249B2A3E|nr:hypothetical protein [Polyangium sp. 15x6]MDI3285162.1 hypothetical protein [Polyangium sp. 15x6]
MSGYRVTFESSLFSPQGADREESHETLQLYLDTLVRANCIIMARRQLPLLYASGARYEAEPRGQENWQDALRVLARKRADCEDLASYRAAELRTRFGVSQARAIFTFWQSPQTLEQRYHCLVRYPMPPTGSRPYVHPSARVVDGNLLEEDPSKVLGMRGAF